MVVTRSPYTHSGETGVDLSHPRRDSNGSGPGGEVETYYGMPAIKPSTWHWLVAIYFFVGGLASACQFIATVIDFFGNKRDRTVVRSGRYIALAGALLSPILLIADLHAPQRWYNMLRIYRRTSAMSVGAWALLMFGTLSGFVAVGQMMEDLGWGIGRWIARAFSLPAALAGAVVSLYTGALLAATNVPLWASAFPFLSSLFTSSAASTATAALTLAAHATGAKARTRRRLAIFSLVTNSTELLFATLIARRWRSKQTGGPIGEQPFKTAYGVGVMGMGIMGPLVLHALEVVRKDRTRGARSRSALAAWMTLVGGLILRVLFIFGGNRSAARPEDYLRLSHSAEGSLHTEP